MLIRKDAINKKLRDFLEDSLLDYFKFKQGEDLDSAVEEVLNDRDLFTFLAVNLDKGKGLWLGYVRIYRNLYDHYNYNLHYGLTLDFEVPRRTAIFSFRSNSPVPYYISQNSIRSLKLGYSLSDEKLKSCFCNHVEGILTHPEIEKFVIDLPFDKR